MTNLSFNIDKTPFKNLRTRCGVSLCLGVCHLAEAHHCGIVATPAMPTEVGGGVLVV